MMWRIVVTFEAEKDLERLDTSIRKRVLEKLAWLRHNFDFIIPLPLGGKWRGFFKLRVGDWRIVYEVETKKFLVIIHRIDRRDKVYKYK
ncbi:MAG: type II toxin-antitoxin system RelE/ParE family toxin [Candidatus Taylorbacteria bacterium]|nr:type II toxin-antitoxin system RelE/ParE family toxin [Candidatus Taylorbacteria bacterium]